MAGMPTDFWSLIAGAINNTNTNIANLGATLMTNLFNRRNVDANNALQMVLADQANQWQRENRDYENWYNSPAGLQSRGLNPALAMSAGGSSLAPSVSAGEAHVAETDAFRAIAPQFTSPSQDQLAMSQIALNEAQANRLNTQSEIERGNLSEEQKRTLIMQQNANIYKREVDAKVQDLANMIFNRDRRYDLDKAMQDFTMNVKQEELNQAWEQIHINEENLRVTLELLPFIKQKYRKEIELLISKAAETDNESRILDINYKYEKLMQDIREEFENDYKAFVTGHWSAETARNSLIHDVSVNERHLAERPFWYWTYKVLSGDAVSNIQGFDKSESKLLTAIQILKMIPK